MSSAVPAPVNDPVRTYAPGSPERASLKAALAEMSAATVDIPHVVGGRESYDGSATALTAPHRHSLRLATVHAAGVPEVDAAVEAALMARSGWAATRFEERAAVFLRAAAMLAGPWRDTLNAATMLGQSKTAHQAEIDAACELIDFWRFNVHFAQRLMAEQPISDGTQWNRLDYRPLEGFVLAITPFNFTSIAGNLPTAPAIMGNTVVWKPALRQMLAAHHLMRLWRAAGLPDGVINLVYADPASLTARVLAHPELAGVHFTGSTSVFQGIWRRVAENLGSYRTYPRLVGETGGKDFILAHSSADPGALLTGLIRGAFEYQGQKCSAASRAYIPRGMWEELRPRLADEVERIAVGDIADFRNFMGAVIDERAFEKHREAIAWANADARHRVVAGGECDSSEGWFVRPTVIETDDAESRLMTEELFGPILTVLPYADDEFESTLEVCDRTSPYALTGAVFATDRTAIALAERALRQAAGNFYINDKPTGAVVGQQPFGGARASGTNDKAGSILNLVRWTSPRAIKENLVPPANHRYPFMDAE